MTNTEEKELAYWKGSTYTAGDIARQINARYGAEEVKNYDPRTNCFTYKTWLAMGFQVNKGEKALQTITFIPCDKKTKAGKVTSGMIPRTVSLFYHLQVSKKI